MLSAAKWFGAVALTASAFVLGSMACSVTTVTTVTEEAGVDEGGGGNPGDPEDKDGDPDSTSDLKGCEGFCAKVESLECKSQSTCKTDCQKQIDQSPAKCKTAVKAMIDCSATKGEFDGCSAAGKPKMTGGCDDETSDYLKCLQSGGAPDAGKADSGGATGTDCKSLELTGKPAACNTCVDNNCCAQESGCYDEPDCNAFYQCVTGGKTQAACKAEHPTGFVAAKAASDCVIANCQSECQ